ncbi:MAG: hypothetical protein JXA89_23005 [Anaerolineae bacterium]|nr:hypothetical protein [Anaerolineae bacterium]
MMDTGLKMDRMRVAVTLLLLVMLAGCTVGTTLPATAARVPTTVGTATVFPTATVVLATPTLEAAVGEMDTELAGRLVSRQVGSPPVIDGQMEAVWTGVEPLQIPLTWGLDSPEHAFDLEMRAVHTEQALYFFAQWPGAPLSGGENTLFNKLTLHWRIPEPAAHVLDCTVVCHTAFADGTGRFVYANTETIPQGGSGALEASGSWDAGTWTLEWGRPLVSANPFDLQFDDPDQAFSFLVKVFERIEGRPDPISDRYLLVFRP